MLQSKYNENSKFIKERKNFIILNTDIYNEIDSLAYVLKPKDVLKKHQ